MSTETSNDVLSFLEKWVLQDGKPVTARLLAVQQQITMHSARAHMQQLLDQTAQAQSSDRKPYALWLLSGSVASQKMDVDDEYDDGEEDDATSAATEAMLLADDDQLEEVKGHFTSTPSVCLYALSAPLASKPTRSHKASAASQLITIQHDLKNTPEYVKTWHDSDRGVSLGALRPADDVTFVGDAGNLAAGVVDQKNDAKPQAGAAAAAVPSKVKGTKTNAAPEASKSKSAPSLFKKGTSKTDKPTPVDDDDDEEALGGGLIGDADDSDAAPPVKAKPVVAKGGAAKQKRADAGDKKMTDAERRKLRKQELMDLADDDHDGNADPDVPMAASTSTSMMGGSAAPAKADKPTAPAEATSHEKRRVRKKRSVTRKETFKDAKGYRVTRDIEEYESYSSFESSEDEAKSSKAKSKGAAKGRASKSTTEAAKKSEPGPDDTAKDSEKISQESEPAPISAQPSKPSAPPPKASAPPPRANAPPPKKPASTAKPTGGQQKLSSFFTRKT